MNWSTEACNAGLNAKLALANGGFADIYGHKSTDASSLGAQPATLDTAITTQTRLVSNALSATAFGTASARQAIANAITAAAIAFTGYARFVRFFKADHATAVLDLSIGMVNPVTSGAAVKNAVALPFAAITAPMYNGDRLLVGGNKTATLSADQAISGTAVNLVVVALADAIAAGETCAYDILFDNAFLQVGAQGGFNVVTVNESRGY